MPENSELEVEVAMTASVKASSEWLAADKPLEGLLGIVATQVLKRTQCQPTALRRFVVGQFSDM